MSSSIVPGVSAGRPASAGDGRTIDPIDERRDRAPSAPRKRQRHSFGFDQAVRVG